MVLLIGELNIDSLEVVVRCFVGSKKRRIQTGVHCARITCKPRKLMARCRHLSRYGSELFVFTALKSYIF